MLKKWVKLFAKGEETVHIQIEKERKKKRILDVVDASSQEDVLTQDLLNGLTKFRQDTASLDYLRKEIEDVLHQKDGEVKLMEGFANALKQQKN